MPVPVRGFLSPGVTGLEICDAVDRGAGDGVDWATEYELVGFSVREDDRLLLLAIGLAEAEGARRLLFDGFGCRPDDCGRRSGLGTGVLEGRAEGVTGFTCSIEAFIERLEPVDSVRSLGNGIELTDIAFGRPFESLPANIVFGVAVFSRPWAKAPTSSSPTGVSGIGRLAVDALEGVAMPVHSSDSCSRIWPRDMVLSEQAPLPLLDAAENTEDAVEFLDSELKLEALLAVLVRA